ncbi:MAG: hypothetical protein LBE21_06385, partial [Pseudomonadales bacterium]|nr:hypothetical protein [Pseudomonadales bacterium]
IADGTLQEQNIDFIRSDTFQRIVDGVFFAAGEALGAAFGVSQLREIGLPVLGISGKLTTSELLIREATAACKVPIYRKEELSDPAQILNIIAVAPARRMSASNQDGPGAEPAALATRNNAENCQGAA